MANRYTTSHPRSALTLLLAAALLPGCMMIQSGEPKDWAAVVLDLRPGDSMPHASQETTLERAWLGFGLVPDTRDKPPVSGPTTVQVRLRTGPTDAKDPQARSSETFEIKNVDVGRPQTTQGDAATTGPLVITMDAPAASLTLTGSQIEWPYGREKVVGGVGRIAFNPAFVSAAREIEAQPTTMTLLRAALVGVSPAELIMYDRLELQPDLAEVIQLVQAGIDPPAIEAYYAAGYGLSVEDLLRLQAAQVAVEDAVAFRKDGFEFTADDLLRLKPQGVTPEYARGMKQAGFADDVEMLIRLRVEKVTTAYANRMRQLGVAPNETALLKLHRDQITPQTVETYQRAGYTPTADQLIALKDAGVKADDALQLRDTGYDFTQEDLIKLARWQVPTTFTVSLMSPDFEPLSVDQIVDMRLRRVTPEMVRILRTPRGAGLPPEADTVDLPPGAEPLPIALPDLPPPEPVEPASAPGG